MRLAAKVLLALGAMIFLYEDAPLVHPDASRQSRFIRTYDPTLGIGQLGRIREWSAGGENAAGRHGVWNSRDIRIHIDVDEVRLPALLDAMQMNVRNTFGRVGSRCVGGSSQGRSAEAAYRNRYEESNATGVVIVGPAYRDTSRSDVSGKFVVPVWIEEQWVPN